MDPSGGTFQAGERVVATAQPARQVQPAAARVFEHSPAVHVDAVTAPGSAGPGGLVRGTEELGSQPDRVAADVVQRAALQFP